MLPELSPDIPAPVAEAIRAYCGWHIAPEITETLVLDGPGGTVLTLPTLRVVEVSEVINNRSTVTDPEWSAGGLVRGSWTTRFRGVSVTLTHGFSDCPAPIVTAAARLTSLLASPVGVTQRSAGPFSESYNGSAAIAADPALSAILAPYKLPPRP